MSIPGNKPFVLEPGVIRPVTAAEKTELEKIGWTPGDPIPGNLATAVATLSKSFAADAAAADQKTVAELAAKGPLQFQEQQAISIDNLPSDKQAELIQAFKDMKNIATSLPTQPPPDIPGLATALAAAEAPPTYNDTPAPVAGTDTGAVVPPPDYCPRCRLNLKNPELLEVSELDKLAYLQSLHGARFKKEISLFGGNYAIVFRWLTPSELTMAYDQVNRDIKGEQINPEGYLAAAYVYRMAMSVESIRTPSQIFPFDPVEKPGKPVDGEVTPLVARLNQLRDETVKSESLWRVLAAEFTKFQTLVERLEFMAAEPNFWPEIPAVR